MKYIKILVLCLLLVPFNVNASTKTYVTKNLEETLKEEAEVAKQAVENKVENATLFEYDLSGYQESDDQITIYMFRGTGCAFCKRFLTFLNSIIPEYGKYFKLESYEVWYNKDNSKLLEKVGDFLEEDAGGVPYIVIGDQVFPGYAPQYDDAIKKAIVDLYNSKDRYDVFVEMAKAEEAAKKVNNFDIKPIITWGAVFTIVAVGASIVFTYNATQKLERKLNIIETTLTEIKELQQTSKEESKKEVKETKTKKTTTKKTTKK